jgi:putative sterol carrier protein
MKRTIAILMLFSIAYATPKSRLSDCEEALQKMTLSKCEVYDTIYLTYTNVVNNNDCIKEVPTRKDVKIAKQSEKTKRRGLITQKHEALAEIKAIKAIEKSDNKVEVKTDKFLNFIQGLTRMSAILMAGGFFAAGGAGFKLLQIAKDKIPFLSWLPI